MQPVTIVMPYYENIGMQREHAKRFKQMPGKWAQNQLRVIIVDDGTPKDHNPAKLMDMGVPFRLFRIEVDVRWNQDAARNIGAKHCETDWMLLTDIDHIAPERTLRYLTGAEHDPTKAYRFGRVTWNADDSLTSYKPHPNSYFMHKSLWEKLGGCDERFAGLYGTDADFRDRLLNIAEIVMTDEILIRVPRDTIPDASTTTYERKAEGDKELGQLLRKRNLTPGWRLQTFRFPYHEVTA